MNAWNSITKIIVGTALILAAIWVGFFVVDVGKGEEWYVLPAVLSCIAVGMGGGVLLQKGLEEENLI